MDTTALLSIQPGDTGIAHTFLRPSGKIIIDNKKIDAMAQGEFIEQGASIIIDKIDQNRVIVKKIN
jgi:membrane-bound serine protease (ClpP class)